jgi:Flp pilus assembly protein TadB
MAGPVLEKRTYATILSFTGITRRTIKWVQRRDVSGFRLVLWWTLAVLFLVGMYYLIVCWYAMTLFFFFIVIPWRVIRRQHRKNAHLQVQQLAALQAIQVGSAGRSGQRPL